MGLRRGIGGLVLLVALGVVLSGCSVLGVGLTLGVTVAENEAEGLTVEDGDVVIDVAQVNLLDPPDVSADIEVRTTGTIGQLYIDAIVVDFAEILDSGLKSEREVVLNYSVESPSLVVGGIGFEENVQYSLPNMITQRLVTDSGSLVGRVYEMTATVTGPSSPPSTRVTVRFVDSSL